MTSSLIRRQMLGAVSLMGLLAAQPTSAQEAPAADTAPVEDIVVTGSRIAGSKITEALPVTVVGEQMMASVAPVSGDDLVRAIPQMGDISFNSTANQGSSNAARGDVGSIDLRGLGVGNTLVLLNGRRVVQHPTSQASPTLAPVLSYNSNAIPVYGIERVEVLRDGAAALYGTDAVAGVINTVLKQNVNGGSLSLQYGGAERTGLHEFNASGSLGTDFAKGRGNVSLLFSYTNRSMLNSNELPFSRSADHRADPAFKGTVFENSVLLDSRSSLSSWGYFNTLSKVPVFNGNTRLTTAAGAFSLQPTAAGGCSYALAGGVCIDDDGSAAGEQNRNQRWDMMANYPITITPSVDRVNLYATSHYDLTDKLTLFAEAGFYYAKSRSFQDADSTIGSVRMTVPASNYWNPFGPVAFADGSLNPNRLAGIDAPAAGLPISITNYRFVDMGPTVVDVTNQQYRLVLGLKGEALGFRWETAGVYSKAKVEDQQDAISSTLLQKNLGLSTPDAYNPFSGGNPLNPSGLDSSPSQQAAFDSFRIKAKRQSTTTLALFDFKASRPDIFALPGGDVGLALGGEVRRDTQFDDRDPHADGTITWTDSVTNTLNGSDFFGVSPSPNIKGARTVLAGYAELAVPLISKEMGVPLVRSLTLQAAGRYEHYSDFGSIAKPKVALAWDIVEGLRLRGSWAQGFRAPNLEQTNASVLSRANTRTDWIQCEADLRAKKLKNEDFSKCANRELTTGRRSGDPDLKPETSETLTFGTVLQPNFLNDGAFRVIFTADYWRVNQTGIVGVFGEGNGLTNDYLLRMQGSYDPNVVRDAPTADDIARFAGTGLTPAGRVLYVNDQYRNLQPQKVEGLDFSLNLGLRETGIGNFSLDLNAAYLLTYDRAPSPDIQKLLDARAAGVINAGTLIPEGGSLIRKDGFPRWRASASLNWDLDQFSAGLFINHRSSVEDTDLRDTATDQYWQVDAYTTASLYVQYELQEEGLLNGLSFRLGVRNLTNARPPQDSSAFGFMASLDSPNPRYWYMNIRKKF